MRQQVNLYTSDFRRDGQLLSSRVIVHSALGFFAVLMLFEAVAAWQLHTAQNRLAALKQAEQTAAARLATYQASQPVSDRAALQAGVEQLQMEVRRREELQSLIGGQHLGNSRGFSVYLEAMARQASGDISLTRIRLLNGGESLELDGWARRAEAVPFYLNKLRGEQSFEQVRFGVLGIKKNEEGSGHLRFTLGKLGESSL